MLPSYLHTIPGMSFVLGQILTFRATDVCLGQVQVDPGAPGEEVPQPEVQMRGG
jgi:hypothetical protein